MKNAFIIHGLGGTREENWFPWLNYQLTVNDYTVTVPQFPTPEGQTLKNWLEVFADYADTVNEQTVLIGHSIGATFALRVLEQLDTPVIATYLVSPVMGVLNDERFDPYNESFLAESFNWDRITANSDTFTVFHGANDPYVPFTHAEQLADATSADLYSIEQGGHLNKEAGYTNFPELLQHILAN